jgi:hypothetical protein
LFCADEEEAMNSTTKHRQQLSFTSTDSIPNATPSNGDEEGVEALRILEGLKSRPKPRGTPTGKEDAAAATRLSAISQSPRASIHDKIRGTLNSISASLSLDANTVGSSSGLGVAGNRSTSAVSSTADSDLAARLNRLKRMEIDNSSKAPISSKGSEN